jgi:hypothetical protein
MEIKTSWEAAQKSGAETIIKDSDAEYRCYMPGEIQRPVAPDPVPEISAWQMRKALSATGLRDQIETAVAGASQEIKDAWQYAASFDRNHPLVVQMVSALGLPDAQVDAVFELGATL